MLAKGYAVILTIILGIFTYACFWAGTEKSLFDGFAVVLDERWGVVTLIDLYAGFLLLAGWIAVVERNPLIAGAWIAGLFLLGNLIGLAYVAKRAFFARSFREIYLRKEIPATGR